jgi:hypothetical protein
VALATAWAAGHRRWSLLVAAFYILGPLGYAVFQLDSPALASCPNPTPAHRPTRPQANGPCPAS